MSGISNAMTAEFSVRRATGLEPADSRRRSIYLLILVAVSLFRLVLGPRSV